MTKSTHSLTHFLVLTYFFCFWDVERENQENNGGFVSIKGDLTDNDGKHVWTLEMKRLGNEYVVRHVTGPFPVSPVPVLAGEVAHRYRL
jgi:hypothetical protein